MATGLTKKGLSASVLAGSDEIFDYYCQPCSIDDIHLEAIGFCSDCEEYLCKTCFECHRKSTASRHHTLLDKSSMPKTKLTPTFKDILTERCPTHQNKVIEYFCNTHGDLCCSVCLNVSHITCTKSYIPEVSVGIASSQEYQQVKAGLDKLVSMVTGHQKEIRISMDNNEKYHKKALADINEFRQEIKKLLEQLENEAVREISRLYDENAENLNMMSAKCQSLSTYLKGLTENLEQNVKTGQNSNLYVQMKQAKGCLPDLEYELNDNKNSRNFRYEFNQDEKLQDIKSALSTLWPMPLIKYAEDIAVRYIRDVNVKTADDTEDCAISGIAVLTDDRIVVTDQDNKSVKLVDAKQDKVKFSISVSSKPCDITVVDEDQVAVVLGNEQKIEIFTVSNTLSRTRTIKVPGAGMVGLQYNGQRFLTVCQHPGAVNIKDMSGKVLSAFSTDSNGKPLFTEPRHIALSRDHDVLYVTDWGDHTVTCMSVSGKVISVYKHDTLKCPKGITVDTDGSVYVCSEDTHTIHQLTPTGTLIQILLGQENGLVEFPCVIAHVPEDDKLYISSSSSSPASCNHVTLFQLK